MNDERVCVAIPATLRHLNILGACLQAWAARLEPAVETEVVQALELAVQEAATNIVVHGYGEAPDQRLELGLAAGGDEVVLELFDGAPPFDPTRAPVPDLDAPRVHGYGVFLLYQLTDAVEYERAGERNCLRLRKRRTAPREMAS